MEKQNFEFEKINNENSTNKKTKKPLLKRLGGALKIAVVTMLVTLVASTFVACDLFNGGRDNPDDLNQGITVPEDPDDPENPIDPDDPENPIDPVNPDENEPQDITEVDEIDEINKFGDKAIKILNDSYLNDVIKKFAGKSATADKIVDGTLDWRIVGTSDNITGIEVSFKYQDNNNINFYAGSVKLPNCSVKELLTGNVEATSYSRDFSNGITTSMEQANKELGNLVINTVNGTKTETQNEGDIWCSIGSVIFSGGKEYRTITVYQITDNQVQKYELISEAPTVNVNEIMQNINDGKIKGKGSCTNEYTFEGQKIEQEKSSNALNAQYNSYSLFNDFDDEYVFE